jgi:DNA repair protein RAD50
MTLTRPFAVYRYIRERRDRALRQCEAHMSEAASRVVELEQLVQDLREEVADMDKEIHESGATLARFRDNLSLRKMKQEIEDLQAEIDQHDLEQAGSAKAQFEERYQVEKEKENKLRSKVSSRLKSQIVSKKKLNNAFQQARLAGELGILKSQLKTSKQELASQFKGIHEKYTKQLVQVKVRTHIPPRRSAG